MLDAITASPTFRSLLRRLGLTRLVAAFRERVGRHPGARYEADFSQLLLTTVRPGDCVWDVGANVGYYTTRLAARVGPEGCVVAFEPVTATFARLQAAVASLNNVLLQPIALGRVTESVCIALDDAAGGGLNSLINRDPQDGSQPRETVSVFRADEAMSRFALPRPAVVKIDVEGFEEDVLDGMRAILESRCCRALFCEVHFALLEKRGYRQAPARIVSLLTDLGYSVKWVDPSHIAAVSKFDTDRGPQN